MPFWRLNKKVDGESNKYYKILTFIILCLYRKLTKRNFMKKIICLIILLGIPGIGISQTQDYNTKTYYPSPNSESKLGFSLLKPEEYKYYFLAISPDSKYDNTPRNFYPNSIPMVYSIYDVRTMKEVRPWYNTPELKSSPIFSSESFFKILPSGDLFFMVKQGFLGSWYVCTNKNGQLKYSIRADDRNMERKEFLVNNEITKASYIKNNDLWVADFDVNSGKFSSDKQVTSLGIFNSGFISSTIFHWYENTIIMNHANNHIYIDINTGNLLDNLTKFEYNRQKVTYGHSLVSPNGRWVYIKGLDETSRTSVFFDCKEFKLKNVKPSFLTDDRGKTDVFWIGEETFLASPFTVRNSRSVPRNIDNSVFASQAFQIDLNNNLPQNASIGYYNKKFTFVNTLGNNEESSFQQYRYSDFGDSYISEGDFSWLSGYLRETYSIGPKAHNLLLTYESVATGSNYNSLVEPNKCSIYDVIKREIHDLHLFESLAADKQDIYSNYYWLDEENLLFNFTVHQVGISNQGTYIYHIPTRKKVKLNSYPISNMTTDIVSMSEVKQVVFKANNFLWKCNFDGSELVKVGDRTTNFQILQRFISPF